MEYPIEVLGFDESPTRQKNRTDLLKAAYEIVIEHGIQHATLQDVVDRSSMTIRSFYNYYDNLYDAFIDIQILCWEQIRKFNDEIVIGKNGYEKITVLTRNVAQWFLKNKDIAKFMVLFDFSYQNKYSTKKLEDYLEEGGFWNMFFEVIHEGVQDGSIIQHEPMELTYTFLQMCYAYIEKYIYYSELRKDEENYGSLLLATELFVRTLKN